MRTLSLLALVPLLASTAGCPTHVLSPPTQYLPLESARPLAAGHTSVGAEGGFASAVFGPEVPGGALILRHGLSDDLELRVDGSAAWITDDSPSDDFRGVLAGRVGLKGLISPDFPHASWIGGVGGGGSAGGGFFSADTGIVFAYENPYVVPFLRMTLFTSVPVGAREVDLSHYDDGDSDGLTGPAVVEAFDTPHTTLGGRVGFGARIPLDPLEISAGFSFAKLIDTRGEEMGLFGFSVSVATEL
ncbi:MAG: hypothetical protein EP329_05750 [Deltaproteobacteria bacterium]|nr:MAG: hypothetical protein EP329_05750 [Deltaproteobacteria bacterium]